ncbi:MAG TPA: sensor domain-containing diguanylate cyclase [Xanthomonadales bacterium]|nr:sensor domain-containing diguanylate cyclase [Xanthomonadales bacterium]
MMPTDDRPSTTVPRLATGVGVVLIGSGVGVLAGWWLDLAVLKSLVPGLATMKANTAVCFVLIGGAILAAKRSTRLMRAAAVAVGLIAIASLVEYAAGVDLRIDQLLFADPVAPGPGQGPPGRMAEMTAINFTLLAAALLATSATTRNGMRPTQWLLLPVAASALIAVLGYLYGVRALYGVAGFSSVALHTALLFLFASLGVSFLQPEAAPARRLASAMADGFVIRRLLPAALVAPPLLGWLSLRGEILGLYDAPYGVALFAVGNIATFAALVWWSARSLGQAQQREEAVSTKHAWKDAILNSADFTVISTDVDGTIRTVNECAARNLGYTPVEMVGRMTPLAIHDAGEVAERAAALTATLGRPVPPDFEAFVAKARIDGSDENDWTYVRRDGSRFPVRLSVTALRDAEGSITGFLGIGKDITAERAAEAARKQAEEELWRLARFDSLTGLANRARFLERLDDAIARSERSGVAMALAYLDLDRFKAINDTWGHPDGDLVLAEFARRVQACVRATDMVARLAGDEFVIVFEGVTHPEELAHVGDKLLLAMRPPIALRATRLTVSASIGIALRRPGEVDAELLQRRADAALYRAKAAGRGCYRIDAGDPGVRADAVRG